MLAGTDFLTVIVRATALPGGLPPIHSAREARIINCANCFPFPQSLASAFPHGPLPSESVSNSNTISTSPLDRSTFAHPRTQPSNWGSANDTAQAGRLLPKTGL